MDLSIAQEFLQFREIFFVEIAKQKELNFLLKEQINALQCEVATLQHQLDDYVSKEHKDLIDKWLEKMPKVAKKVKVIGFNVEFME